MDIALTRTVSLLGVAILVAIIARRLRLPYTVGLALQHSSWLSVQNQLESDLRPFGNPQILSRDHRLGRRHQLSNLPGCGYRNKKAGFLIVVKNASEICAHVAIMLRFGALIAPAVAQDSVINPRAMIL
jgi:hypothetical protein